MDCFYAAVEMRDNPEYRNVPIAVGGTGPRSVLCTCNYIAREYGVRSAMPNGQALSLCPKLVIVSGRMSVYKAVSAQIREIFSRYTEIIEPLSLDEAYLDVSNSELFNGSATLIAEKIRADIFNETGLTASAGVAPNKFIAKIASDENKPNGQCVVSPKQIDDFVKNMPLKKIPGIGPKTAHKLSQNGFNSCADVRKASIAELQLIVGKFAPALYQRSFGIDERSLEVTRQRKSLAIETTLAEDLVSTEQCLQVLTNLLPKLRQRLEKLTDKNIIKQGIKVKFSDFSQTTVEQKSEQSNEQVYVELLNKALARGEGKSVRLVGLTLGFGQNPEQTKQLSLPM